MSLDGLLVTKSQRESLEKATATYAANVEAVGPYLGARGISRETAVSFRLGSVTDALPGHERFEGMLCIPYLDAHGRPVSLKFRNLVDGARPKYDQPAAQQPRLFNVSALTADVDQVAVCEGELDAVLLTQLGVPAVGVPGASHHRPHWIRCFADYEVLVVADNDRKEDGSNPGMTHARKLVKEFDGRARLVTPPEGMDLTDWVLAAGADEVLAHFV